jgi:cell division protein FtsB
VRVVLYILLAVFLLLQLRLWVSDDGYRAAWRIAGQVTAQEQENEALRERNLALEAEVADLKGGLDAVEEIARTELGMIREGETMYQVVDPEEDEFETAGGGR